MNARNSHMSFLLSFHGVLLSPSYTRLLYSSPPRIIESQTPSFSVFISTPPLQLPPSNRRVLLSSFLSPLVPAFISSSSSCLFQDKSIFGFLLQGSSVCLEQKKERGIHHTHTHSFFLSFSHTNPRTKGKTKESKKRRLVMWKGGKQKLECQQVEWGKWKRGRRTGSRMIRLG